MERKTRQREAIRLAFQHADRPLSASEVMETAGGETQGLSQATVYRALKALVEEGWLIPVDLPGESPRYEVAGKEHHGHFHCRGCGRVYDFECPHPTLCAPRGFRIERHEMLVRGLCAQCSKSSRSQQMPSASR